MLRSRTNQNRFQLPKRAGFFVSIGAVLAWIYYRRNISNEKPAIHGILSR